MWQIIINFKYSNNFLQMTKFLKIEIKKRLIFHYFNIRNSRIPKYGSFYIESFQMFTPTRCLLQNNNFKNVTSMVILINQKDLQPFLLPLD